MPSFRKSKSGVGVCTPDTYTRESKVRSESEKLTDRVDESSPPRYPSRKKGSSGRRFRISPIKKRGDESPSASTGRARKVSLSRSPRGKRGTVAVDNEDPTEDGTITSHEAVLGLDPYLPQVGDQEYLISKPLRPSPEPPFPPTVASPTSVLEPKFCLRPEDMGFECSSSKQASPKRGGYLRKKKKESGSVSSSPSSSRGSPGKRADTMLSPNRDTAGQLQLPNAKATQRAVEDQKSMVSTSSSTKSSKRSGSKQHQRLRIPVDPAASPASSSRTSPRHARVKKIRVNEHSNATEKSGALPPGMTEDMDRVFMLLLEPNAKIFELIQVYYDPDVATVGDLIKKIPENTTEKALATQSYEGLTRPKRRSEPWLDTNLTTLRAGIRDGHVLVPIPNGYQPKHIVRLGKTILSNPRIQDLLDRADPTRCHHHTRRGSGSRSHHASGSSVRSGLVPPPMESVVEEPDEKTEQRMQRAIEHAQEDNAKISSNSTHHSIAASSHSSSDAKSRELIHPGSIRSRRSLSSLLMTSPNNRQSQMEQSFSSRSEASSVELQDLLQSTSTPTLTGAYDEDSLAGSYSSWSQSLDTSFVGPNGQRCLNNSNSSITHRLKAAQSTESRRKRQRRFKRNIRLCALSSFLLMVGWYWYDPNKSEVNTGEAADSPMGTFGGVQFGLVLFVLIKLQRWSQTNHRTISDSKCPFLKASHRALEHLRDHREQASLRKKAY